jgi:adenylate kinase family enzyme
MVEYSAKTAQVIEHYRGKGCFAEVDGARPVAVVAAGIGEALRRLRTRP